MNLDQLIAAAAQALGAPEPMVRRSVMARAKADGVAPETLAAQWAGVDPSSVSADSAPAAPAEAPPAAAAAAPAAAAPAVEVEVVPAEVFVEEEPEPVFEPEPEPEEVPVELPVATAGIRQNRRLSMPRWLVASFFVVPFVAVLYAASFATGPGCGNGGALAIDPVTGAAENCDGTEFGNPAGNPLRLGAGLYTVDASPNCASCHGGAGEGGTGPALSGGAVLATFPTCADHIQWVALGTNRWRDEVGPTYGATAKPVGGGGVMQSYEDSGLTLEEIAAVVLFERVNFGGQSRAEAETDCLEDALATLEASGEAAG